MEPLKLLIYLENQEIQKLIAFNLESSFEVKVQETNSVVDCVKRIQKDQGVDIVLCEGTEQTGSVVHYLAHNRVKKPAIVCVFNQSNKTGTFGVRTLLGIVSGEKMLEEIGQLISKYHKDRWQILSPDVPYQPLNKTAAKSNQKVEATTAASAPEKPVNKVFGDQDLCRISTTLLVRVSPLKAGVFIKLSSEKYLRIFQEGDSFDKEDLEKYLNKKKVDFFYLLNSECNEFTAKLADDLKKILATLSKDPEKMAAVNEKIAPEVYNTVQGLARNLGMTPELQQVVKTQVEMAVKSLGRSPRLAKFLDRIKSQSGGYQQSHSALLGELASTLAKAAGWHTEATFHKLSLAAFMHDITLSSDKLAMVQSIDEMTARQDEFTAVEQKEYKEHPLVAAELVRQMSDVPPDVDMIIMQHHERPDGSGFPRGQVSANISPLSACFIVAHDLLFEMLTQKNNFDMKKFLESRSDFYVGGNFKKVVKALNDMVAGK